MSVNFSLNPDLATFEDLKTPGGIGDPVLLTKISRGLGSCFPGFGATLLPVPGDGHCALHAVAYFSLKKEGRDLSQIHFSLKDYSRNLRRKVVGSLLASLGGGVTPKEDNFLLNAVFGKYQRDKIFKTDVDGETACVKDLCAYIGGASFEDYLGPSELIHLSHTVQRPIFILSQSHNDALQFGSFGLGNFAASEAIFLFHWKGGDGKHYDVVDFFQKSFTGNSFQSHLETLQMNLSYLDSGYIPSSEPLLQFESISSSTLDSTVIQLSKTIKAPVFLFSANSSYSHNRTGSSCKCHSIGLDTFSQSTPIVLWVLEKDNKVTVHNDCTTFSFLKEGQETYTSYMTKRGVTITPLKQTTSAEDKRTPTAAYGTRGSSARLSGVSSNECSGVPSRECLETPLLSSTAANKTVQHRVSALDTSEVSSGSPAILSGPSFVGKLQPPSPLHDGSLLGPLYTEVVLALSSLSGPPTGKSYLEAQQMLLKSSNAKRAAAGTLSARIGSAIKDKKAVFDEVTAVQGFYLTVPSLYGPKPNSALWTQGALVNAYCRLYSLDTLERGDWGMSLPPLPPSLLHLVQVHPEFSVPSPTGESSASINSSSTSKTSAIFNSSAIASVSAGASASTSASSASLIMLPAHVRPFFIFAAALESYSREMVESKSLHSGICSVRGTLEMLIEAKVYVNNTKSFALRESEVESVLLVSQMGVCANLGYVFKGMVRGALKRKKVRGELELEC